MDHSNLDPQMQKKVQKHFEMTEEIYRLVKKHDRWMRGQRAWALAKILIAIIIIVSAWIYIPPFLKQLVDNYKNFDIMKILPDSTSRIK